MIRTRMYRSSLSVTHVALVFTSSVETEDSQQLEWVDSFWVQLSGLFNTRGSCCIFNQRVSSHLSCLCFQSLLWWGHLSSAQGKEEEEKVWAKEEKKKVSPAARFIVRHLVSYFPTCIRWEAGNGWNSCSWFVFPLQVSFPQPVATEEEEKEEEEEL